MGNGISRIETEMRKMDNERREQFNLLWDKISENRDGIIKGQENNKMLVKILNKRVEQEKGIREEFRNGSIQKTEFMKAIDRFADLQQETIGEDMFMPR